MQILPFRLPIEVTLRTFFLERLVGIYGACLRKQAPLRALVFLRCRCLHTFFIRRRLLLVFVSDSGRPLRHFWSRPWGVYFCRVAMHAIELDWQALTAHEKNRVKEWLQEMPTANLKKHPPVGYSLIEALVVLPVVLLMGLLVVQLGLLAQQALTVNYAVSQSVRELGAAGGSLTKGLALGLSPLLLKDSSGLGTLSAAGQVVVRSQTALAQARLQGWVDWKVLEPKPEAFYDWGLGAEQFLVPPAWIKHELASLQPRSGAGSGGGVSSKTNVQAQLGLVTGQRSGVNRLDASRLKVRFVVGLPLNIPLAGPLLAKAVSWSRGCSYLSTKQLGALRLTSQSLADYSVTVNSQELAHDCLLLTQGGFQSKLGPRLPIRFEVTAQAQSVLDPKTF